MDEKTTIPDEERCETKNSINGSRCLLKKDHPKVDDGTGGHCFAMPGFDEDFWDALDRGDIHIGRPPPRKK